MQDLDIELKFNDIYRQGFNHEETRKLFVQYNEDRLNGIAPKDSNARTLLITANLKLINFVIVDKLKRGYCDTDGDEYGFGKIGLIKAVDKFDVNKDMKFSSFAVKVILNEILMYHRTQNTIKNTTNRTTISLEQYLEDGEEQGSFNRTKCLIDENDFRDDVLFEDDCKLIFNSLKYFTPQDQYLIVFYFGLYGNQSKSHKQIGEVLKVSRTEITRRYANVIKKLKLILTPACDLDGEQRYLRKKLMQQTYPLIDEALKHAENSYNINKRL